MGKVFFIADLHFGHKKSIQFDGRPWKNLDEMERALIEKWNAKVGERDDVFIVGDMFAFANAAHAGEIMRMLHGKKHLIIGNHDPKGAFFAELYEEVVPYKVIQVRVKGIKQKVVMRHRMLPLYKGQNEGVVHLFGHTHNTVASEYEERYMALLRWIGIPYEAYNVGACKMEYEPRTLEEILESAGRVLGRTE